MDTLFKPHTADAEAGFINSLVAAQDVAGAEGVQDMERRGLQGSWKAICAPKKLGRAFTDEEREQRRNTSDTAKECPLFQR